MKPFTRKYSKEEDLHGSTFYCDVGIGTTPVTTSTAPPMQDAILGNYVINVAAI
jgi:hypothetical protein